MELGKLWYRIALEGMDDFNDDVNNAKNNTESSSNKIVDAFKKIGGAIVTYLTVQKIVEFGKSCIGIASDLTEVQNVVDTVFPTMNGQINSFSKNASSQFGLTELQAKNFTGSMGAMLSSMGLTEEESYSMSTSLVGLTGDMSSFYNLDHDTAWEKIRSGISGETEPLKQLGINMSVTNLEAYALAQGISKPYAEMSQSEQTILRYNYLMSVTANAQGDFAKTADTSLANSLRVAKNNFTDIQGAIGSLLLPTVLDITKKINELAEKIKAHIPTYDEMQAKIKSLSDMFEKNKDKINAVIGVIEILVATWAGFKIGSALQTMIQGFQAARIQVALFSATTNGAGVAQGILNGTLSLGETIIALFTGKVTLAQIAQAGMAKAQAVLNAVMAANPIALVVTAIVALIAIVVVLYNKCEWFRNMVDALWNWLMTTMSGFVTWFQTTLQNVATFFTNIWNGMTSFLSTAMNAVKSVITTVWNSISNTISSVVNSIKNVVSNVFNTVKSVVTNVFNGIKSVATNVWNAIKSAITSPIEKARDTVKGIIDKIKGFFNFSWSLPKLKMPHVSIKGEFSLVPPSVPSFGIDWYAKGGIMTEPTIFGYNPETGKVKVGGEAGAEAVAPIDVLLGYVRTAVAEQNIGLAEAIERLIAMLAEYLPQLLNKDSQLVLDTGVLVGQTAHAMNAELGNIYSRNGRGG